MSVSTDGQICFGIKFDEGYEFPWDDVEWDGDIEQWWIYAVCKYQNPFEIWNGQGEYIDGVRPPESQVDEYYKKRRAFLETHPVPVELVNYCSGDYPRWILATSSSCIRCSRGYPTWFRPENLIMIDHEVQSLIAFCKEHCQPRDEYVEFPKLEPKWYLSSYWG